VRLISSVRRSRLCVLSIYIYMYIYKAGTDSACAHNRLDVLADLVGLVLGSSAGISKVLGVMKREPPAWVRSYSIKRGTVMPSSVAAAAAVTSSYDGSGGSSSG
jgi:hypothetical protein